MGRVNVYTDANFIAFIWLSFPLSSGVKDFVSLGTRHMVMSCTKNERKCRSKCYGKISYSSFKYEFETQARCPYRKFKSQVEVWSRGWKRKIAEAQIWEAQE